MRDERERDDVGGREERKINMDKKVQTRGNEGNRRKERKRQRRGREKEERFIEGMEGRKSKLKIDEEEC